MNVWLLNVEIRNLVNKQANATEKVIDNSEKCQHPNLLENRWNYFKLFLWPKKSCRSFSKILNEPKLNLLKYCTVGHLHKFHSHQYEFHEPKKRNRILRQKLHSEAPSNKCQSRITPIFIWLQYPPTTWYKLSTSYYRVSLSFG